MKHIQIRHPKVKKIIKLVFIVSIVFMTYLMGEGRGMILGISFTQQKHNETVCDFLGKERDTDGFCLLKNGTYKYRWYIDCGYEKFKINGNQTPPFILKYTEYGRRMLYYPVLGC